MVGPKDRATPGQEVLVQLAGSLVLTHSAKMGGQASGRGQRVGMVRSEDRTATGEDVLVQFASGLAITEVRQVTGEVIR